MGRVKFSRRLRKHSFLHSFNSTPKGQQVRLLRSHDIPYIKKTIKTKDELRLDQRVVTILFIRMEQITPANVF